MLLARSLSVLAILALVGCVNPTHDLRHLGTMRSHVNGELLSRTDNNLTPIELASDTVIPDLVNWEDGLWNTTMIQPW
jgi:hypothetical protein